MGLRRSDQGRVLALAVVAGGEICLTSDCRVMLNQATLTVSVVTFSRTSEAAYSPPGPTP
jgi:hypothetical protein